MIIGNRIIDIGLEKVETFVQCLQKQQSHAVVLKVKENHGVLRILRRNGGSQTKPINTLGGKITSDFHGLLCPSSSTGLVLTGWQTEESASGLQSTAALR